MQKPKHFDQTNIFSSLLFIWRYILGLWSSVAPALTSILTAGGATWTPWSGTPWGASTSHSVQSSECVVISHINGQLLLLSFCSVPGACAESFPGRKQFHQFSIHKWETGFERLTLLKTKLGSGPSKSEFIPYCFFSQSRRLGVGLDTEMEAFAPRKLWDTDEYTCVKKCPADMGGQLSYFFQGAKASRGK